MSQAERNWHTLPEFRVDEFNANSPLKLTRSVETNRCFASFSMILSTEAGFILS